MVVTLSGAGYIKAHKSDEYYNRTQTRGGTGLTAAGTKDGDVITDLHHANSHDMVLFFTSRGRVYWKKIYQLPSYTSRNSWGRPVVNILPLVEGEADPGDADRRRPGAGTTCGCSWRPATASSSRHRAEGLRQSPQPPASSRISIDDGDRLIGAKLARKDSQAMLFTDGGKAVRFAASKVRSLGRTARRRQGHPPARGPGSGLAGGGRRSQEAARPDGDRHRQGQAHRDRGLHPAQPRAARA